MASSILSTSANILKLFLDYANLLEETPQLLQSVLAARPNPDPREAATLQSLARSLPRVLQLLPALFPDKGDVQQIAGLSDMLCSLHRLAGSLFLAGYVGAPLSAALYPD